MLKGRNRVLFYAQLRRNVQRLLRDLGPLELRQRGGVLAVLSPAPVDELAERARDVLGVNLLHPALVLEKTPEAACAAAIDLLRDRQGATFAIRARRRDKGWRLTSHELATVVGKAVQDELGLASTSRTPTSRCTWRWTSTSCSRSPSGSPAAAGCPSASRGAPSASSPAASTRRSPPTAR